MLKQLETGQWAIIFETETTLTELLIFRESLIDIMICVDEAHKKMPINLRPILTILRSMIILPDNAVVLADVLRKTTD